VNANAINPCSDVANAERFADRYQSELFYLPQSGWHHWTDTHWAYDQFKAERCAQGIGRLVFEEAERFAAAAANSDDSQEREKYGVLAAKLNQFAMKSETAMKVNATLKLAASHLVRLPETLDTDPWLLNTPNGTLNLQTGQLQAHNPGDLITRCLDTRYEPDAECPLWERTLEQVFAGDTDLINYIQRVMGYCLTGSVKEQVFFILYGGGANGKSTIIGCLSTRGNESQSSLSEGQTYLMIYSVEQHGTG
jgi:putative DNA primase/helicase